MSNEFTPFTIIIWLSFHSRKGKIPRIIIRKKQTQNNIGWLPFGFPNIISYPITLRMYLSRKEIFQASLRSNSSWLRSFRTWGSVQDYFYFSRLEYRCAAFLAEMFFQVCQENHARITKYDNIKYLLQWNTFPFWRLLSKQCDFISTLQANSLHKFFNHGWSNHSSCY